MLCLLTNRLLVETRNNGNPNASFKNTYFCVSLKSFNPEYPTSDNISYPDTAPTFFTRNAKVL